MGFSKDIITRAVAEKRARKEAAENKAWAKKDKIYTENLRLSEIDRSVSAAWLSGENAGVEKLIREKEDILDKLGINAKTDFEPQYSCKKCNDSGYFKTKLCDCTQNLCKKITCEELSALLPLEASRFDNFDLGYYRDASHGGIFAENRMEDIYAFCKAYADNFAPSSGNILLAGNTGLGKTHLSLAIANEVITKGYSVIYSTASAIIAGAENEKFRNNTGYLENLLSCDLLIIDDLGTEFATPFSVSVVNDIINSRLLKNQSTIISTNLTLEQIGDKYTPRVTSRIVGNYALKQVLGSDIRVLKNRAQR